MKRFLAELSGLGGASSAGPQLVAKSMMVVRSPTDLCRIVG
jgi:hypothetical protein